MTKKKEKNFKLLRIIVDIIYNIVEFFIALDIIMRIFDMHKEWFELDEIGFFSNFILYFIIVLVIKYIVYIIAIICHEIGHLIFGLKAKLDFVEFNVLGFSITKEKGKLKIKKLRNIPGIGGYCNLTFNESKKYTKKDIKSFFLGGVLVNLILAISFVPVLILSNNLYLDIFAIYFIELNLYLFIYNLIPAIQKTGINTDMLHIINANNDPDYTKALGRVDKINKLVLSGKKLSELDPNLLYKPQKLINGMQIKLAQIYIDYQTEKEQYDDAIKYINHILTKDNTHLSQPDINLLNVQMILCLINQKAPPKELKKYFDKNVKKYINMMSLLNPTLLPIKYLSLKIIEEKEQEAEKCLNKINKLKQSNLDKNILSETEELLELIEDYSNQPGN